MQKFCVVLLTIFFAMNGYSDPLPLEKLTLPPGYSIQVFADNVPGSRTLTRSDSGVIFVGTRGKGNVYALIPSKNPEEKMQTITLLSGLNEPNGVAYYKGDLYVAEINRILKYEKVDQHLDKMPEPIVVTDALPTEKWHGYRVMKIGPDEKIYVSIGMPCNTCDDRDKNPLFGTITRMSLDGKNLEPYAIGLRNSMGFDWRPQTHDLWISDNGQDLLGDDIPPEEINLAKKSGMDFGFPFVYGDNIFYPGYTAENIKGLTLTPPEFKIQAHSAPLGLMFIEPNKMLVALHGSWNRSKKVGYQVIQVDLEGDKVTGSTPFVSGWLQGEEAWGRPVDFLILPNKSVLITDDLNGVIYEVKKSHS